MSVVNVCPLAGVLTISLVAVIPAWAADNLRIERFATCQDSRLDWKKSDPPQLKNLLRAFNQIFRGRRKIHSLFQNQTRLLLDFRLFRCSPRILVWRLVCRSWLKQILTPPKRARRKDRQVVSVNATPSDNIRTCELEIGEKKTSLLMTEDNVKSKTTLLGFYYFYAK
jgi:hypothetical protein